MYVHEMHFMNGSWHFIHVKFVKFIYYVVAKFFMHSTVNYMHFRIDLPQRNLRSQLLKESQHMIYRSPYIMLVGSSEAMWVKFLAQEITVSTHKHAHTLVSYKYFLLHTTKFSTHTVTDSLLLLWHPPTFDKKPTISNKNCYNCISWNNE